MKQTFFTLLYIAHIAAATAQNNNILRGVITIKGEDNKPLRGVVVQAVGISNKAYTYDNGFYALTCTGMSAGDVVSLIVTKENYVVVDKSTLKEVIIRKNPNQRVDIVMQEESKRKSDVDRAEKNIKDYINLKTDKQTKIILAYLAEIEEKLKQKSIKDIERRFYQDSIKKLEAERTTLAQDRDRALQLAHETAEKLTVFSSNAVELSSLQIKVANRGKIPIVRAEVNLTVSGSLQNPRLTNKEGMVIYEVPKGSKVFYEIDKENYKPNKDSLKVLEKLYNTPVTLDTFIRSICDIKTNFYPFRKDFKYKEQPLKYHWWVSVISLGVTLISSGVAIDANIKANTAYNRIMNRDILSPKSFIDENIQQNHEYIDTRDKCLFAVGVSGAVFLATRINIECKKKKCPKK